MQKLASHQLIPSDLWDAAKESCLRRQKMELADGLFSLEEGVWHNVRWHREVEFADGGNVASAIYLDARDQPSDESEYIVKLFHLYGMICRLEELCRSLFRGCKWQQEVEVPQVDWDTFVEDMQERMDELGLLEGESE